MLILNTIIMAKKFDINTLINSLRRERTELKQDVKLKEQKIAAQSDEIIALKSEMRVLKYEYNKLKSRVIEHKGKMFVVSELESELFSTNFEIHKTQ